MSAQALSSDGRVRVEWIYLDEGRCGEYDPSDPTDEALLRFDTYVSADLPEALLDTLAAEAGYDDAGWLMPQDGSYCTNVPYDTDLGVQRRLAQVIAEELSDSLGGGRFKRRAEEMSWVDPSWAGQQVPPAPNSCAQ